MNALVDEVNQKNLLQWKRLRIATQQHLGVEDVNHTDKTTRCACVRTSEMPSRA